MRLLIFAIFAISAIITIEGTQPNSKRDVWLLSLIIPMLSAFTAAFFAWCLFTFKGSYFTHLSFNLIVCYIPTVIYLHANLKKKLKAKENFKYNAKRYLTIASILGIIGFVYGIIYVYNENETEKKQEHELSVYHYCPGYLCNYAKLSKSDSCRMSLSPVSVMSILLNSSVNGICSKSTRPMAWEKM